MVAAHGRAHRGRLWRRVGLGGLRWHPGEDVLEAEVKEVQDVGKARGDVCGVALAVRWRRVAVVGSAAMPWIALGDNAPLLGVALHAMRW